MNLLLDTHVLLWWLDDHAHAVGDLPAHHRDPFDRILVAQAKVEGLTLVSRDVHLKRYKIPFIEA